MRKIKIFLTTLAIAGVLFATSSCVDDSESASVTELRGVRADQLKAKAELDRAQATAALRLAEAEYLRAEGERLASEAQASYYDALTESEKESLRLQILKNDDAIAQLAIKSQIDLLELQAKLTIAKATANLQIQDRLSNLIYAYEQATTALTRASTSLAVKTLDLAKAQLDLASYTETGAAKFVDNYRIGQEKALRIAQAKLAAAQTSKLEWDAANLQESAAVLAKIEVKKAQLNAFYGDTLVKLYAAIQPAKDEVEIATKNIDTINKAIAKYEEVVDRNGKIHIYIPTTYYTGTTEKVYIAGIEYSYKTSSTTLTLGKEVFYLIGYNEPYNQNIYASKNADGEYNWIRVSERANNNSVVYASKEAYIDENPIKENEELRDVLLDTVAYYQKAISDVTKSLEGLNADVVKAESDLVKAKKDFETAKKTYETKYKTGNDVTIWGRILVGADTSAINNAAKAVNGKVFTTKNNPPDGWIYWANNATDFNWNTPSIFIDTLGGAEGKVALAQNKYYDALTKLDQYTAAISTAKTEYYNIVALIEAYNETLEILETPYGELQLKLVDLTNVLKAKEKVLTDAEGARTDAEAAAAQLSTDISTLEDLLLGAVVTVFDDNGKVTGIKYEPVSQEALQTKIDDIDENINNQTAAIAEIQKRLDNLELYAQDNETVAGGYLGQAVAYVKARLADYVEKLTKEIAQLEQEVKAYEVNQKAYEAAINALLSEEGE